MQSVRPRRAGYAREKADLRVALDGHKRPLFNENLMNEIFRTKYLQATLKRIKRNYGSAGRLLSVDELPACLKVNWPECKV